MDRNEPLISALRADLTRSDAVEAALRAIADNRRVELTGATLEARALVLASVQERLQRKIVVVVANEASLSDFASALRLFHTSPDCVATYPNPSLSPYQDVAPSLSVVRDEIRALGRISSGTVDLLVVPARALLRRLPLPAEFAARSVRIELSMELDLRLLLEQLVESGYSRVDLVGEVGEFAFRGGIIDIFPPDLDKPIRIELFGDAVDSIRHFDVETQRSSDELRIATLHPMSQFPLSRAARSAVARRLSTDFNDPLYREDLADKTDRLSEHQTFPGIENYLPVALESATFPEYLRATAGEWLVVAINPEEVSTTIDKFETLLRNEYEVASEKGKAVYPPERLLAEAAEIHNFLNFAPLSMSDLHLSANDASEQRLRGGATERYINRLSDFARDVQAMREAGGRQVVFAATKGGSEKIERLLKEFDLPFSHEPDRISDVLTITHGQLATGFYLQDLNLRLFSEWDLFEPPTSTRVGGKRRTTEAFLTDLRDLKAGDYIVHIDHGIGRFVGLQRIPFGETVREVMELEYSTGGKLLLPMESLNLIQKYSGGADSQPKLDKLGGSTWSRTKASVKKAMRDMADELLKLYATRKMVAGHAFGPDTPWQFEFEEAFEFQETDDQLTAVEDIKADMESRKPMDRLLCGDVGYGKTEVAMRAAFKSVMDGKQVALLAPTTILAYQHYRTFLRRMASFPVTIELSSRFRSPKEQKEIVKKVQDGEIDVLIGTHRILSRTVDFKDLGLMIIDEEQRFGVAQKEKLKQFKKAIDVLSMSATPIPRTLHMSLSGIRDISVIETPPKDRLAIQTAVVPFNDDFVKEAIEFEIARGGQVFFLHNRVESIYGTKEYLEKLVPGLRVVVGHGQMDEQELERAMAAFIARDFDLLLATTIVENGIDIPAANTILINHAERFGLSQLYQLRGRVGRSDRLAFCYLLVPANRQLTSDARKRLAAIQEFSDLGAGFRIAAKDLEIRGAGNMLGGEQSGQIASVGFETYTKLLEETIRELKGEKIEEEIDTSINIGVDIYIPKDFIEDENLRMTFYKKVASARDDQRLEDIRGEMRDRFGALPENVEALLQFIRLKLLAKNIGVISIAREGAKAAVRFQPTAKIDPNRLLEMLQANAEAKFTPAGVLSLPVETRGRALIEELQSILANVAA